jgi:GNAT superfamily N-acetyltransferase
MPLPEGLTLRPAGRADIAVVMRHREEMFRAIGYCDESALAIAQGLSRPLFEQGLGDGTYPAWLVVDRAGVVVAGGGIVLLRHHASPADPQDRRPVVVNVFTEPEHRRRGLARHLMATMIAWARSHGYGTLYLHASRNGRALYESLGFVATNEMRLRL